MRYKTSKLKERIVEKFGTQKAFSHALGMVESNLSRKLSCGRDWKGREMMRAVELLEIPADEVESYFFTPEVEKKQPRKGVKC